MAIPYLEIGYTGLSKARVGKRTYHYYCNPPTIVNYSTNATTSYYLPEFGDYAWVQVELNATFSPEVLEYFNKYREIYRLALPENDQNGRKITWTDISGYKMKTYNPNIVFVKKKELSGRLDPDVGKTTMALWTGFVYVYELLSIPIYRPVITKSNIEINLSVDDIPKEGAYFYEILNMTNCTR
ncbi:hypothetical protein GPJ56_008367 [Histomonas meleagridis]|nr:hypothetical protein GPJ56_008367 [Histomonas meleagridis]